MHFVQLGQRACHVCPRKLICQSLQVISMPKLAEDQTQQRQGMPAFTKSTSSTASHSVNPAACHCALHSTINFCAMTAGFCAMTAGNSSL